MKLSISKEKFTFLIKWYVLLQPLLDFITSLTVRFTASSVTVGMLFRILFIGLIGIYFLFFYKAEYKKTLLGTYIFTAVYGIANIIISALYSGTGTLLENGKMFFKMYYFVFVLLFFFALYKEKEFTVSDKSLTVVFICYASTIFISAITNTSFVTYDYAKGYCGWFYAANETGAIISCLAAVALFYALNAKNWVLKISVFFLIAFVSVYIGTKVPFLACFGIIILLTLFYIIKWIITKTPTARNFSLQLIALFLVTVLLFQLNSPIKQNNSVMTNEHFDSHVTENLDDDDPEEKAELYDHDHIKAVLNNSDFAYKTFLIANWLLSDRLIIIIPAIDAYLKSSLPQKLFGLGYIFETPANTTFKNLIEMDFAALIINHGIIGFLIYIVVIGIFAVICIKKFFKNIKQFFLMERELTYIYAILITIACAFLAGHVFVAPAVSIYPAIIIIKLFAELNARTPLEHKNSASQIGDNRYDT